MSVQVLRVRFPNLSLVLSVERPRRKRERRLPPANAIELERDRLTRRFPSIAEIEPSLAKLRI
jgi:hypothetical protein